MPRKKNESNRVAIFMAAKYFFDGMSAKDIAKKINQELKLPKPLSRESIYPMLAEARRLKYIRLVPPLEEEMPKQIAQRFNCNEEHITVVRTPAKHLNEFVAYKAAEIALDLIRATAAATKKKEIGLGLGPGRATLDFCQHLGQLLQSETNVPKLNLHAISAGCPARYPEYASSSFFNLFPRNIVENRIGLFAETVVRCRDFEKIKTCYGVTEAFEAKKEIDLIITSMGDFNDEHDLLSTFLVQSGAPLKTLRDQGWIGSVQYRPYSKDGPIQENPDDMRAVTIFELDDFATMAATKN
ncbi:MAG: hypothetical protein ABSA26_16795, partial [Thermoguttaceae bacterium]